MKILFLLFVLLPCLVLAESSTRVLAPVESRSRVIEGLEFSIVTQSEWRNSGHRIHDSEPIILQLRMVNRTKKAILFPTFDSFLVRLETSDGAGESLGGGRNGNRITPNILLEPGAGNSMLIDAIINHKGDSKDVELIVKDGTGSIATAT